MNNLFLNWGGARATNYRREGDSARDAGEWALAENLYAKYLRLKPNDFDIWVQYGHMLKEQGKIEEAVRAYDAAIDINPSDYDVFLCRGHALKLMGYMEDALDSYAKSTILHPAENDAVDEIIALQGGGSKRGVMIQLRHAGAFAPDEKDAKSDVPRKEKRSIIGRDNVGIRLDELSHEVARLRRLNNSYSDILKLLISDLDRLGLSVEKKLEISRRMNILNENRGMLRVDGSLEKFGDVPPRVLDIYFQLKNKIAPQIEGDK